MAQKTRLEGLSSKSTIHEVSTHQNNDKPSGMVTYTTPLERFTNSPTFFLNTETGALQMAVDATFSGDIEGVHNGLDTTLWSGSQPVGVWDFESTTQAQAGTKSIEGAGTNNAQAVIASTSSIDMDEIEAFTGWVYFTSWDDTRNDSEVNLSFSGSSVSDSLSINNYVEPSTINAWQKITIPKSDFNLTDNIVNEVVFTTIRNSGPVAGYFLDTLQFERLGAGSTLQVYRASPPAGGKYYPDTITITIIYPTSGSGVAATTGMPVVSYDKFGHLPKLTAGLLFQVQSDGEQVINFPVRCHEDLILSSFTTNIAHADDNNTVISWVFKVDPPNLLDSAKNDFMSFTVSDDLSQLTSLKIGLQGTTLKKDDFI